MTGSEHEPTRLGKVLLVEDDPMIRALTAEWIEDAGFEVRDVGDGQEALGCVEEGEHFHAAILDVSLPDMDGSALAGRLRAVLPALPVLFATGNPNLLDGTDGPPEGTEILRKPYSATDLHAALKGLLAPSGP